MHRAHGPFGFCLNTSTISGQKLPLPEMIRVAGAAGYDAIEPWVREVDAYTAAGGSLPALRRQLRDAGLKVPNLIGFFEWGVADAARRQKGMEEARRCLELAAQVGATGLATPPMGLVNETGVDLGALAERYAAVLALGREFGVRSILEFWGVSKTLGRLGEALHVAAEAGQPEACVLADVFHMYKGSGHFAGLKLLGRKTLALVHLNDYPAAPPRATITDAERVYPGDGTAPLGEILRDLHAAGYRGMLSLELFNRAYWAQDAATVAATGLAKARAAVAAALA